MPKRSTWLVGMAIDRRDGTPLTGSLYQESVENTKYFTVFQLKGTQLAKTLVVVLDSVLQDRHPDIPNWKWCAEPISFTYDEREEKLSGRNATGQSIRCGVFTFTLFRVKLKSSPVVPAAASTTLRVSGRDVRWYSDPALKHLVAQGNTFSTRLQKATTFYIMQGFYPSRKSTATAVTIRIKPALKPVAKKQPSAYAPLIMASVAPVVLPTVLFYMGTATLLPTATPALSQLAAELRARPTLRVRLAGHTDRVGEPDKNRALSEQRAAAVIAFLVKSGIAPTRLVAVGYGDARPIYPTPDARNRRVEVEEVK